MTVVVCRWWSYLPCSSMTLFQEMILASTPLVERTAGEGDGRGRKVEYLQNVNILYKCLEHVSYICIL